MNRFAQLGAFIYFYWSSKCCRLASRAYVYLASKIGTLHTHFWVGTHSYGEARKLLIKILRR